jgi:cytochrome c556
MNFAATLAATAAACALAAPAAAQFSKPEDAVKYRQSIMFVMSQHFGRVGAMANGRVPFDAKAAADNADFVAELSRMPWPAYVAGTDKGQTRAKSEIWAEPAKFRELNDKLMAETGKLQVAAKTGNLDNMKKAFGDTAAVCKSCHDAFRKD